MRHFLDHPVGWAPARLAEIYDEYALLDTILEEAGLTPARDDLRHDEEHRLSAATITHLLADSGFKAARVFEQDFSMHFADGSAMLRHSLVKWFLDSWRQAVGAENERDVFNTLQARLNAGAERDGCVEMCVPMLYLEAIAV